MSDTVFTISNLELSYGSLHVLKNINLHIHQKEVTALIGPSGCGKSTLLRTLNRLNDLIEECRVSGQIHYLGNDIYQMNPIILRLKVGMVFQKANPFPMSIYDNVAYGPRCQGIKKKEILDPLVEEALKQAALWEEVKDRLKESALSLSGGQQQRLCIARTICLKPDVILMDEPTSALDPLATLKIEQLIRELKNKYTIIIVTHNMQQASRISDNTVFLLMGEVIESGKTKELFLNPKQKKTYEYVNGLFG